MQQTNGAALADAHMSPSDPLCRCRARWLQRGHLPSYSARPHDRARAAAPLQVRARGMTRRRPPRAHFSRAGTSCENSPGRCGTETGGRAAAAGSTSIARGARPWPALTSASKAGSGRH
ncbi:hypothetical protein OH77DRAFT_1015799 [Trametes cingulata]|nr:hypothetical protein OH77DRAFT_1015799 [Trametes cingulata]